MALKIWIDIANSPHVAFMAPFIRRLENSGHELVITARELGNTIELLHKHRIRFTQVDGHGGKHAAGKVLSFISRCHRLRRHIRPLHVDLAFTQSSFYVPLVAASLSIPSLYTNDNEHAKGNIVSYLFASHILLPEPLRGVAEPRIRRRHVDYYPGVKEGIYLSQSPTLGPASDGRPHTIYFRPEPWTAQYHTPSKDYSVEALRLMAEFGPVIVLPRDNLQREAFKRVFAGSQKSNVTIAEEVVSLQEIKDTAMLFVGAGGSMTRELAVLGVPAISIYGGKDLAVDNYLLRHRHLRKARSLDELHACISELLESRNRPRSSDLLEKGSKAFDKFLDQLTSIHPAHD